MRHGRAKQARKTLQFFQRITNGALRPPYFLLLDGTFLVALVQYKLMDEMMHRLDRLLQHATIHLTTTRSTLQELTKLEQACTTSNSTEKAFLFRQARTWAETHCTQILEEQDIPDESTVHISTIPTTPESVKEGGGGKRKHGRRGGRGSAGGNSSAELSQVGKDLLRIVLGVLVEQEEETSKKDEGGEDSNDETKEKDGRDGRNHHGKRQRRQRQQQQQSRYYFVASQDEQVLDRLRHLGHVPIIRLARGSVLLLEQPSKAATQQAWREERRKWRMGGGGGGTGSAEAATNNTAASSMLQQERNEAQRLVQEERQERRREQQQQQQQLYTTRRKKKAKGPNPLSCKKRSGGSGTHEQAGSKNKQKR